MDLWAADKLLWFIAFFTPGFISLKIWDFLIPSERRDFSKSLLEVVGYSTINFAVFLGWIVPIAVGAADPKKDLPGFISQNCYTLLVILIVFPAIWPVLWYAVCCRWICRFLPHPIPKPWDFVFANKKSYIISIRLKSSEMVVGYFGGRSFASSNPSKEQIYLEKVYVPQPNGELLEVPKTQGVIVFGDSIDFISLFNPDLQQEEKPCPKTGCVKWLSTPLTWSLLKEATQQLMRGKRGTPEQASPLPQSNPLQSGTSPSQSTSPVVTQEHHPEAEAIPLAEGQAPITQAPDQ